MSVPYYPPDPIFRLAEHERKKAGPTAPTKRLSQLELLKLQLEWIKEKEKVIAQAKTEGLIPPEATKVKVTPIDVPVDLPGKHWTEKQFETEFGVTISPDLPSGAMITGYKVLEVPTVLPSKYWREAQFEHLYGVTISPDLPKGAYITGYEKLPSGEMKITWVPPTRKTFEIQYLPSTTERQYKFEFYMPGPEQPAIQPAWKTETLTGKVYEKGITETLSDWLLGALGYKPVRIPIPEHPLSRAWKTSSFQAQAGFIGTVESYIRPDIPTPIGAVITKVTGGQTAYERGEVSASFALGGIAGEIVQSYLLGKAVGVAYTGAKRLAPEFVKRSLGRVSWTVTKTVKFSRVWKAGHKVRLELLKLKPWISYGPITRGEVALAGKEAFSLTRERVARMAFDLSVAPRTGAVWLTNIGLAPAKEQVFQHLISRGGLISIGYLRELPAFEPIWQRGLLPYVTQMQVTRAGITPYVPAIVSMTGKKAGLLSLSTVSLAVPSLLRGPVMPQRLERRQVERVMPLSIPRIETMLKERQAQKERLTPILRTELTSLLSTGEIQEPRISTDLALAQTTKTVLTPILKTPTILRAPPVTPTSKLIIPPSKFPEFREPRVSDLDKIFGVKWFKKEHKVAEPSEVLRKVMGDRSRTRTDKRRSKAWPFM